MTDIVHDHPLKELHTFGLDIKAERYASPRGVDALTRLLEGERGNHAPLLIVGEGSNILFLNDFEGLVLKPCMKGVELLEETGEDLLVRVGAGENWDHWVAHALEQRWYGLENLSLIPGSVGSSPVQNIGAYGVELQDHFESLNAWDLKLNRHVKLDRESCMFGYRSSIFKEGARGRYIITHVTFRLHKKAELHLDYGKVKEEFAKTGGSTPGDLRNAIIAIRRSKLPDPEQFGNAGSFFKNPTIDRTLFNCIRVEHPDVPSYPDDGNQMKIPAGWLIEKTGWKGKRVGNVGTWPTQSLVIVNYGGATGREILEFSERIREDVDRLFGVSLEREVQVI